MKTILNNSKTFIKYALTIMLFAVLLGSIFVIGFGFNGSSEFGKVYEVTVDCFDENKIDDFTTATKNVLKEYGYSAAEVIVEDRSYCDTIVVRYKSTSANNATLIEQAIESNLELNDTLVTMNALSYSSATSSAIKLLITLGLVAVIVFAYALVRFKWKVALTMLLNYLFSALLPLAILSITRLELSTTTLGIIAILSGLSTVLLMAIVSKMYAIAKLQEKRASFADNYYAYISENKLKAIIPAALLVLVFVCLIFTFNASLVQVGVAGLISLVVIAFVVICFSPAFLVMLSENTTKQSKR